jgi:hypothetical protein
LQVCARHRRRVSDVVRWPLQGQSDRVIRTIPADSAPREPCSAAAGGFFHRSLCMLQFILDRAKEPSTYAGVATLLTAAGIHYTTDIFNAAVAVAVAVAGLVAVLLPEKKAP